MTGFIPVGSWRRNVVIFLGKYVEAIPEPVREPGASFCWYHWANYHAPSTEQRRTPPRVSEIETWGQHPRQRCRSVGRSVVVVVLLLLLDDSSPLRREHDDVDETAATGIETSSNFRRESPKEGLE